MGRIKTKLIKTLTEELFEKYRGSFTTDFGKNKSIVDARIEGSSKKVRNVISGYITRLVKTREA